MASIDGLSGDLEVDGSSYGFVTSMSIDLTRSVAEVFLMGSNFSEKAVGPYSGTFGGSAVVQDSDRTLFDDLTGGSSHSYAMYPDTTSSSNYWSWSGKMSDWSAEASSDGFWEIDFSGIIDGAITATGFN